MKKRLLLLVLSAFAIQLPAKAQLGGSRAFEYLNLPSNARLAALGGVNLTSGWDDPAQAIYNPALLGSEMHNRLVVSRLSYFADIANTSVSYIRNFEHYGTWSLNVGYLNYGDIESFDQDGFLNGSFKVHEYVFSVGNMQRFGPFSVGANLKLASSDLASFQASALIFDLGGTFKHPEKDLTVGFLVRNLGVLLSDYIDGNNSQLPLDVQLGLSYKPEFMPFRFSLAARNLNRADVVYYDASSNVLLGEDDEPGFSEEIFRRLVFGTEILLSPNFQARLGYNHLIRQELKNQNGANGGAGFSFGFMFRTKRFEFAFSRALYHAAGGSNTFQLNMDLNGLIKKRTND
ncbi:type IX secretion system protein PorQ [Roseivirga sp.]|uniref:type IX secretion system protein PorQ n=1 Tax=Roseivirga sp. TaxID=1964215 RepID=UPI003B519811